MQLIDCDSLETPSIAIVFNSKFLFAIFLGGGTVVPGTDYAYSPAYTQYGSAYGSYGYSAAAGGLLSK